MSREENKRSTASAGNGLTLGGSNIQISRPTFKSSSSVKTRNPHYEGETDSGHTLTGVGDGITNINSGDAQQSWGHTTNSGSSISISDSAGNESVSIQHHSGAAINIDPDGAIFITSTARKGIGISSPFGDAFMDASGEIVLKGSSMSMETSGDCNFNVGGTFNLKSSGYKLTTKIMDENIDGSVSRSVTNDYSEIVGGIKRTTIAGDQRTQVTGNDITDVGVDKTERVTGNSVENTKGNKSIITTGDSLITSQGTLTTAAQGTATHSSKGDMKVVSDSDNTISAGADLNTASGGATKVSAASSLSIVGSSSAKMSSDGPVSMEGVGSAKVVGSLAIIGGTTVSLATPTVLGPVPSGSGGSTSASVDSITTDEDYVVTEDADEAEVMEANNIVDDLTSVRKYPEFPSNAKLQSADAGSVYTVAHDSSPSSDEAFNEYSSKNYGSTSPVSQEKYQTIPDISDGERKTNIKGVNPDISIPDKNSTSTKISRYFTLGNLVNANSSEPIPSELFESVVANFILVAYNVLDPIKEKFPDMEVTSAWRNSRPNHITGLAIDFVTGSRNAAIHAEMANFAKNNLPVDQVYLERNKSKRTHVHVRYSPNGGSPRTLTCADPKCHNNTPGIDLEYLYKRGVKR